MLNYVVRALPAAHLYEVTLRLSVETLRHDDLVAASWTTGSYLMREFASNLRDLRAHSVERNQPLSVERLSKARWHIHTDDLHPNELVEISWQAFAYSLGIHDAWLDEERGFINPAALFIFPSAQRADTPVRILFDTPNYEVVSALPKAERNECSPVFETDAFERFLDSPFYLITPLARCIRFSMEVCGTQHEILITGINSLNVDRVKHDLARIFETVIRFWSPKKARAPFDRYLLSLHLAPGLYGGLEHAEGTVLLHDPKALPAEGEADMPKAYEDFLTLVAHEYFHAWLVKRIRPSVFEPYDLTREAYTSELWLYEGFTSYYESRLCLDAGVIDETGWQNAFGERLSVTLSQEGFDQMSLAESSLSTWVKLYRRTADSPYSQTSYYGKGALLAFILDRKIRRLTAETSVSSLDDVLRRLYETYLDARKNGTWHGLQKGDFERAVRHYAGCNLDDLIHTLINEASSAHDLWRSELREALQSLDLTLKIDESSPASLRLAGLRTKAGADGKAYVQYVPSESPAFRAGLFSGDELIALDGERVTGATIDRQIERLRGRSASVLWFRHNRILSGTLDLAQPLSAAFLERLPQKIVPVAANSTPETEQP